MTHYDEYFFKATTLDWPDDHQATGRSDILNISLLFSLKEALGETVKNNQRSS